MSWLQKYDCSKFRVVPHSQLSEQHFDEFPVWSEHYDFDEIEDIERWGLDREQVLKLFDEHSPGNEHCVYTLLESNPFPGRLRIFIRAVLMASDGRRLKGFVMNEDAYCLCIYYSGEKFYFSRNSLLGSLNENEEQQLIKAIGNPAKIFPIQYETEFKSKSGVLIAGEFAYGADVV